MRALVLESPATGLEDLLERRRRTGLDRLDEVWEGVLHMVPAPDHAHASVEWQLAAILRPAAQAAGLEATGQCNLGTDERDFRVPDGALHRPGAGGTWHPTAALVVEIVSPGDETWEKLPFYAARGVEELLILDPRERSVAWLGLAEGEYRPVERSGLIELTATEIARKIDWPPVD